MSRTIRRCNPGCISDKATVRDGEYAVMHAPAWFRRERNTARRAKEKQAVRELRDVPRFRNDAAWLWW